MREIPEGEPFSPYCCRWRSRGRHWEGMENFSEERGEYPHAFPSLPQKHPSLSKDFCAYRIPVRRLFQCHVFRGGKRRWRLPGKGVPLWDSGRGASGCSCGHESSFVRNWEAGSFHCPPFPERAAIIPCRFSFPLRPERFAPPRRWTARRVSFEM